MLEDGTYDVLVFDAHDGPAGPGGGVTVELTILGGAHKGDAISVVSPDWSGDPLDLLGVPGTLTVTDGQPSVVFES